MKNVTKEDKLRILARNFFTDNRDQYEDYHEALAEFMSPSTGVTDQFVDFGVQNYLEPAPEGYALFISEDGHVAEIGEVDGHMVTRTDMTEEEGDEFEAKFEKAADNLPDLTGYEILAGIGWKRVEW